MIHLRLILYHHNERDERKDEENTYPPSSGSCFKAFLAIVWKACSTLMASLALVSKYGMLPLVWHHAKARFWETFTEN